ncbi:hypothetical protein LLEC1_06963 [Akanthomyces lecanii]|uniref:Uncharacterized protein n=1 Tax=Cordyceps confragosa TaxID=2714763 RepID=A0A179I1K0_CORDF|nr:hypothetical protein LLEC1_06963 [Akanthomyces lecanii]
MPTLAELETKFEELTAIREAAKYDVDLEPERRVKLAAEHRAVHTQLFAARKEAAAAAAAASSSAPEPEMVGVPTLAELESKSKEHDKIVQAASSDFTISNAKKREMSIERVTLRSELIAARREAQAIKQQEEWAREEQAFGSSGVSAQSR